MSPTGQAGYRDDIDAVRPAVGRLLARKNHEERGRLLHHVSESIGEVGPFLLRKLDFASSEKLSET